MRTAAHPCRWLIAAGLLGLAVQPVMLPHPVWVQAVTGGAAAAQGYALAALGGLLPRWFSARWPALRTRMPSPGTPVTAAGGVAVVLVATVTAHLGQVAAAGRIGAPGPTWAADVLAVAGAAVFGTTVIGLVIGVRTGLRAVVRGLRRTPRRIAALVLVPGLVLTGSSTAAARTTDGSTIRATVGAEGAAFLRDRPDRTAISAVTGRPALTPVRIYIGKDAAAAPARRAELAVQELERTGGFTRAAILINIPTGSGWVNPAAGSALEYLYGGDVATVVVQYSDSPSWVAYLRGGEGVQASTRALTDAVRAELDRRPARRRPRLLVYGESLGAWGGLRAYPGDQGAGMARRTDGTLWAGVPGPAPATPVPAAPAAGATAAEATAAEVTAAGATAKDSRTLVHADDPVPAWSLPLFLRDSATWPGRWLPVVSFWQATGDTMVATEAPPGHGHRYGPELVDAWRPLISTTGVPGAAPPDRLTAVRWAIG
jgi:uncharacterized membrane protein